MELHTILTAVFGVLLGLVAFFAKIVYNKLQGKIDYLLDRDREAGIETALLAQRLEIAENLISGHHSKIGAQAMRSNEFDILFAQIDTKLNQVLSAIQKDDNNNKP